MMAIVRGPTPLARRGHYLSIAGRVGIIPRQSRCQIRSGRWNAKFSIDVTQVKLDRFSGHEELAGDLARGVPRRRQRGDAPLARGQRLPAPLGSAGPPAATGRQLRLSLAAERDGAPILCELHGPRQRDLRRRAPVRSARRPAEIYERAQILQATGMLAPDRVRFGQQVGATPTLGSETEHALASDHETDYLALVCALPLLLGQMPCLGGLANGQPRQGGGQPPAD